jgi:tellurite resistance protein TehA-like permease
MNTILFFLVQVILTLIIVSLIVAYLRPHLRKVLIDLCGTEDRAQFWTVFSNVLLIGIPLIFSLNYRPETGKAEELFFDVAEKLSGNLGGLLFAMIGIGIIVSFFALVAPRGSKAEAK